MIEGRSILFNIHRDNEVYHQLQYPWSLRLKLVDQFGRSYKLTPAANLKWYA